MAHAAILPTSNTTSSTTSGSSTPRQQTQDTHQASSFRRLHEDVSIHYADIPVCLCSLVSGLCDSVAFNASAVFVSMQTGNTLFLGLGAAGLPAHSPDLWLKALCSISAFIAGVFCFGQTRRFRPTSRLTLAASFLLQSALICVAAALAQSGVVPAFARLEHVQELGEGGDADLRVLGPVVLLAFQFGGQIVSSRMLGFNEVPTNVLTSVYCDIFNDPNLFVAWNENPKRNRRASAVVLMLIGAVAGAWLAKSKAGMSSPLWIAAFLKFSIAAAWLFWRPKAPSREK